MNNFIREIKGIVPKKNILTKELQRLAWGTDASFYRLLPQVVVITENEEQVSQILAIASQMKLPVTFRAAGTSLSGQSITDSVLLVAAKNWEGYSIADDASEIRLQPGIVGARVNELLSGHGRIFTPDPASKGSAMVGGIVMNNASGMNCGTHANSDKMLRSMRIVLADGTVIDTAKPCQSEREKKLLQTLADIRDEIRADEELVHRIKRKYEIKNVTGLNLRPFVAYDDPRDILAHVMVGSEGTLGFMSEVVMATAPLLPFQATGMAYFSDMAEACRAVVYLRKHAPEVYSCELLDKKSLASVHDSTGSGLTALLIETRADSEDKLASNIASIQSALAGFKLFKEPRFTSDPDETARYWTMRAGIFPAVGGTRPVGTTSLIEDIAFHIDDLPQATVELARLIEDCGYDDACIYGHAFEGNYHFVIAQAFETQADIDKYRNLIHAIVELVVDKYDGSLKAEHGTGRNMAPFVEKEWGDKAYALMVRVKQAFDPDNILNPGVIFNLDRECYLKNLKPLPPVDACVDKCIECGFCEVNCVSCGFTISARQRIAVQREIARLKSTRQEPETLEALQSQYHYYGADTCAGDGLCSLSCPMGINTADLTHKVRQSYITKGSAAYKFGEYAAAHIAGMESALRPVLGVASIAHSVLGDSATAAVGRALHKVGLPLWTPSLPSPRRAYKGAAPAPGTNGTVVYFPSCINQTMGVSHTKGSKVQKPLIETMVELCHKAGYRVIFPKDMKKLCCGMIWESKGMPEVADAKTAQLEAALLEASEGGKHPVLCDQSPCLHRMREHIKSIPLYEPAEFIATYLAPHMQFHPVDTPVAVHITCSSRLMGVGDTLVQLARKCSTRVLVPEQVGCCGFAGDKGFTEPGLNAWGLRKLRPQIEAAGIKQGYSNSRTCEIGLTTNSGIPYQSIAYLVNEATTPK